MSKLEEFLDGERLDDVVLFISDAHLDDDSRLRNVGVAVDGGVRLVLDGEAGRAAFEAGIGVGAMEFAGTAMGTVGRIDRSLDGGLCPFANDVEKTDAADELTGADGSIGTDELTGADESDHDVRFVFAFSEGRNEDVGGIYAEGDVIHAYAQCSCGTAYSDQWIVGDE